MSESPRDVRQSPRRILIIQTAFLGDLVLTLPLIDAVSKRWPETRLAVLARSGAAQVLERHPAITKLLVYQKQGRKRSLGGMLQVVTELKRLQCDLALIPHRSFRSALMAKLAGIPQRIGFADTPGAWLYTRRIPRDLEKYEAARNLDLLPDAADESVIPSLAQDARAAAEVEGLVRAPLDQKDKLIALAPGSVWPTKRWPEEHWCELAQRLVKAGNPCVIVGGPEDQELGNRLAAAVNGGVTNAAGELSIKGSAELLRRCRLLVSGDTAPVHLAVATGTPTLVIFGPTVPEFGFAPIGEDDRVIGLELDCRPCRIHGSKRCPLGHHHCMVKLAPDMVERVVQAQRYGL